MGKTLDRVILNLKYFPLIIVAGSVVAVSAYFSLWLGKEIQMSLTRSEAVQCELVARKVIPENRFPMSTRYATIWNCGEYGHLATTDEDVFRLGKQTATLLIKQSKYDTRIVGIEQ